VKGKSHAKTQRRKGREEVGKEEKKIEKNFFFSFFLFAPLRLGVRMQNL
jgi:hypothetical protein